MLADTRELSQLNIWLAIGRGPFDVDKLRNRYRRGTCGIDVGAARHSLRVRHRMTELDAIHRLHPAKDGPRSLAQANAFVILTKYSARGHCQRFAKYVKSSVSRPVDICFAAVGGWAAMR